MTDVTYWQAEAERLRAALDQSQQQTQEALDNWAAALADRRAELARAERYRAERDAALAELARAREVLRYVEWTPNRDPYGDPTLTCPECERAQHEGHAPNCALSAALAAKGGCDGS